MAHKKGKICLRFNLKLYKGLVKYLKFLKSLYLTVHQQIQAVNISVQYLQGYFSRRISVEE
jgi:hypothetical protein